MPIKPGQGKTAVALFVDGLELKYVQLAMRGTRVHLIDYKTVVLAQKFQERQPVTSPTEQEFGFGDLSSVDAFSAAAPSAEPEEEGGPASNASVFLEVLGDLPPMRYTLSYALSEPGITYHEFDRDFGLKGSKLRKHLVQELSTIRATTPSPDQIGTIPTRNEGLLTVVREDGLQLYDVLLELKPFLGNKLPKVDIIDSADVALMNLVRGSYELLEEEVSIVVYVGSEFSRLIFMQGNDYLHFAPIISEGYNSPNIENTLYSRILLEQDNLAMTRIDRILLAGDAHRVNLRDSLSPLLPSAAVEYVMAPEIDLGEFEEGSVGDAISEYAVPLATAWRTLVPAHPGFYQLNLVPGTVIERQKVFKLAWHGWIAAVAMIFSIVFFSNSITKQAQEIRTARELLSSRQGELNDLRILQSQRDTLAMGIQRYAMAATVYDSIAPGGDKWSRVLHYLANSVDDLNSLWIYSIKQAAPGSDNLIISGRSIYRTRIPRLASLFEQATLQAVRTTTIRDKIIYEFDILVEQLDRADLIYRRSSTTGK
jgi:Tfp pilus assembly protein PilN